MVSGSYGVPLSIVASWRNVRPVVILSSIVVARIAVGRTVVIALCHTCRTASVVVVTVVTAIPTVAHAHMLITCSERAEVVMTALVIASAAIVAPAVTATIGQVEMWTTEIEVVAMRIAGIDAEVPYTSLPVERAVEVGSCAKQIPLPAIEYITDIQVTALPVGAKHIVIACDAHQIVQVNLIGSFILCIRQVQFVCHLICQEEGLSASLFV